VSALRTSAEVFSRVAQPTRNEAVELMVAKVLRMKGSITEIQFRKALLGYCME